MYKKTERGFAPLLILVIVGIVAIGGFFFFSKSKPKEVSLSTDTKEQVAQVVVPAIVTEEVSTTTEDIQPKKEIETPQKSTLVVEDSNKDKIVTKVTAKVTPAPTPEVTWSEPTLVVEKGEQPKQTLLLADTRNVPFTVAKLTAHGGDIVVDGLVVERKGLSSDRVFVEVGVEDVDYERALNASHQYETHESFTVADGETMDIVLFGNITDQETLAEYEAQMPALALVNIKTNAKISGVLPIIGTPHTVNSSIAIGSVSLTRGTNDPNTNRDLEINSTNQKFTGIRGEVSGTENILLQSFAFLQRGSASPDDLKNVQICLEYKNTTNCYDAEYDDKYYYKDFDDIQINKGEWFEVYIKGDIGTSGVNRTVDLDLDSSYDVAVYGTTYKNNFHPYGGEDEGPMPEGEFSVSEVPLYNAYSHTIRGATAVYIGR